MIIFAILCLIIAFFLAIAAGQEDSLFAGLFAFVFLLVGSATLIVYGTTLGMVSNPADFANNNNDGTMTYSLVGTSPSTHNGGEARIAVLSDGDQERMYRFPSFPPEGYVLKEVESGRKLLVPETLVSSKK